MTRATLVAAGFAIVAAGSVSAEILDLPVVRPSQTDVTAPAFVADRLEIRLRDPAASAARALRPDFSQPARRAGLGVAAVDRVAEELGGAWFEPEFRGERPPPAGSSEPDFTAFYIVHLPETADLAVALSRFRSLDEVTSADPIAIMPASLFPDDSLWSQSTWFFQPSGRDIRAPFAWDVTTGDSSIVVAVLDTGVLPYHPDLGGGVAGWAGRIWTNPIEAQGLPGVDDDGNFYVDDLHGWDFVETSAGAQLGEDGEYEDNDPNDFAGHGTFVAGLVGALSNNRIGVTGTAWDVRIMPLRVGWSARSSSLGLFDMSFVARGIRYATRMGASVINASFATRDQGGLAEAAAAAVRAGVTIVAAAGNDRQQHDLAEREDVIAVAATDAEDRVASFSNLGPYVDIAAPGNDIRSTFIFRRPSATDSLTVREPSYGILSGTSMSAPMVSGTVALMQALRRQMGLRPLQPIEVSLRLRETADDISHLNPGVSGYGSGRLNAFRALADPPTTSASRIGGATVGAAVVLPTPEGTNQFAYVTTNQMLLILEGRGDTVSLAALPGTPLSSLAAADLSPGRIPGLFAILEGGRLAGYGRGGLPLPGWPVTASGRELLSGPALGDLDGDGTPEVMCGDDRGDVWAWHADGRVVAGFPSPTDAAPMGNALALSDLDGAPGVEIVVTTQAGRIHVIRGDGSPAPGWPRSVPTPVSSPVIARLGSRIAPAIIVSAGPTLRAFRDGAPVLTVPQGGIAAQDLAVGDLDGDGFDEIVVVIANPWRIAVFDSAGVMLSTRNWPYALPSEARGAPVIGQLLGGTGETDPEILVAINEGQLALTSDARALPNFPKPGNAGRAATLIDLERTGSTQVLAGTGADSVLYMYEAGPRSAFGREPPWPTPRGNFARTGSRLYAPSLTVPDLLAPAAVTDLAAEAIGPTSVTLVWTAPGDDGRAGQATAYDLRYATFPLEDDAFSSGDSATGVPAPARAGEVERYVVGGLEQGVTYFFALRSRDEVGNESPVSNVLAATTGSGEPGRVLDLAAIAATDGSVTLRWRATGDDGPAGRPESYLLRAAERRLDPDSFDSAPHAREVAASVEVGAMETFVFDGLERARDHWFALKARDDRGNLSRLSNVVVKRTEVGGPLAGRTGPAVASRMQPSRLPVEFYWQGAGGSPGGQWIRLFDAAGRRVRWLPLGTEASGVLKWDGRDDHGSLVPAGLYFARLTSGSIHVHTRVVLLP